LIEKVHVIDITPLIPYAELVRQNLLPEDETTLKADGTKAEQAELTKALDVFRFFLMDIEEVRRNAEGG
jgi:hypothetical protein